MNTTKLLTRLVLPLAVLSACTSTGMGGGQISGAGQPEQPVTFNWKSTDAGMSGSMTASLPGATFQGRFFQITETTRGETLTPLWSHWHRGWYDWPYRGGSSPFAYPTIQFITHYSGKVVATLQAPDQQRMRCRFHLVKPENGMTGGGEGECQLSDGRLILADFAAQ